jgi:hypothetical protein
VAVWKDGQGPDRHGCRCPACHRQIVLGKVAAHFPELDEAIRKWLAGGGMPMTVGNFKKFLPPASTDLYVPRPPGMPVSPNTTVRFPTQGNGELSGFGFRSLLRLLRRPKQASARIRILDGVFEPADFEKAAVLASFGPAVEQLTLSLTRVISDPGADDERPSQGLAAGIPPRIAGPCRAPAAATGTGSADSSSS